MRENFNTKFVVIGINDDKAIDEIRNYFNNDFRIGFGSYKGERELSIIVVLEKDESIDKCLKFAYKHNQESILFIDTDRTCKLVSCVKFEKCKDLDKSSIFLGENNLLKEITKAKANQLDGFMNFNNKYYSVEITSDNFSKFYSLYN